MKHGSGSNSRGNRGGSRGGFQYHRGGGHQRGASTAIYDQQQYQPPSLTNTPPAQAYINPAFVTPSHAQPRHSHVDPNALAQVMSYMSTPAGVQSMATFASHMSNTENAHAQASQASQASPPRQSLLGPRYSPSRQAGQKRKLGDRNNNMQGPALASSKPQSSKPPRAKAAVAPPVPNFGFSLPIPSTSQNRTSANTNIKKDQKKPKLNLGLTENALLAGPPSDTEDKDGEEDVDEEAAYAQKLKGGGFAFEHNGEQIIIQTAAEVAAWIKDRRKNFPTQKRIVEKAQETARKRARELDFLRKVRGVPREQKQENMTRTDKPSRTQNSQPGREDLQKSPAKVEQDQENLAALRKKLHDSMMNKHERAPTVNLNVGYESDSSLATDAESSVVSSSSDDSSTEEDSEGSEDVASEDEAPTSLSSKIQPPPIRVPPPAPLPPPPTHEADGGQGNKKPCDTWQRTGRCKFSHKCRYAHPPRSQDTSRLSLYDRLVEQECVESDGRALEAIKWLGSNGLLG